MKKILLFALLIAFTSNTIFAQDAETQKIIDKHIEAIGGTDAWKKINTVISAGSMKAQGAEIGITISQIKDKAINKLRMTSRCQQLKTYLGR